MFIKNIDPFKTWSVPEEKKLNLAVLYAVGLALIFAGIIVIVAVIVASARGAGKGKVKAAGVIMIGPIPIIFGTDKKSVKRVLTLALALTVAAIVAMVVFYWFLR
jgi:uncharacterized protein (TIGR00304 family)